MDDDATRRSEEIDALRSLYGDEDVTEEALDLLDSSVAISKTSTSSVSTNTTNELKLIAKWKIRINETGSVFLELLIPSTYPSCDAPIPKIICSSKYTLDHETKINLEKEMLEMWGEDMEVAILWAEHCRSASESIRIEETECSASAGDSNDRNNSGIGGSLNGDNSAIRTFIPPTSKYNQPIRHFPLNVITDDEANARTIHKGKPYHPPKSGPSELMIGFCAEVSSIKHVEWVLAKLLFDDKKVSKATHNMFAYKFYDESKSNKVLVSDNDDDGEKGSGKTLASLLELTSVSNVIVIVSRWYGGVHLGPARFKHISNVGRDVLKEYDFIT